MGRIIATGILLLFGLVAEAAAAVLPTGFSESLVASGISSPTAMAFAPDGRLFVCQQGGQLRVIKEGTLLPAPFVSLTVNASGERGLLGIAFDPNFAVNKFLYVYYTATTPTIHNRVSRFTANGDVAVPGSETIILELETLTTATNHNGGALHFDADGTLLIAVGDNANGANSQTLANRKGKMLRINADGSIPTDNPFYLQATGVNRSIWALGLRNPFTFDIRNARMFINDVGQNTFEEINDGIAGSNYGWPESEGPTTNPNHRAPIFYYDHGAGGCAITGGAFYVPDVGQFPATYLGRYFFADYCAGWIRVFDPSAGTASGFATGISAPVDLKVGPEGSLYYIARGTGAVWKISYSANQTPQITQHPAGQTVTEGQSVTFTVGATGSQPLSYRWQRNRTDIPGATSTSYTIAAVTLADDGAMFRALVTNPFGTATSNEALLDVTPGGNSPPVATITQPATGTLYTAGMTINYAGTGTDSQDGTLPPSAFTWRIDFHHDTHTHPFMLATSGATGGSFTIPRTGETSANVWYRIILTVTDSAGSSTTTFRDVKPRTVSITLTAQQAGLQLTLDGQPVVAPHTFVGVVGMFRTIGAPSPQTFNGMNYTFRSWSDGGGQTHQITTPTSATTFNARYQRRKR
jgi:glucose/arabinose dehydrogenase